MVAIRKILTFLHAILPQLACSGNWSKIKLKVRPENLCRYHIAKPPLHLSYKRLLDITAGISHPRNDDSGLFNNRSSTIGFNPSRRDCD